MNNKSYVIKRADGFLYEIESPLQGSELLEKLRADYISQDNIFSTFTPHVNKIPVAIYFKIGEKGRNE